MSATIDQDLQCSSDNDKNDNDHGYDDNDPDDESVWMIDAPHVF